jgi:hypothetical protein
MYSYLTEQVGLTDLVCPARDFVSTRELELMFLDQFGGFAPVDLVRRFEEAFALHMSVPKQGERFFGPESPGDLPVGVRLVDPVKSFCRDGEVEGAFLLRPVFEGAGAHHDRRIGGQLASCDRGESFAELDAEDAISPVSERLRRLIGAAAELEYPALGR